MVRSRVFGALRHCPAHFVFDNREIIVIKRGREVDWGIFLRSFLEKFVVIVNIRGYVGTVNS